MKPNLYVRYKGSLPENAGQIALADLGQSLIGFDTLLKDLARILRVDGELEVRVAATKEGSIIVEVLAILNNASNGLPFESVGDFLDFLKLTGDALYEEAQSYFNSIGVGHRALNDWASKSPLDVMVFAALLGKAFQVLIKKAKKQKTVADLNDPALPKRIAEELHRLILRKGFKRALFPLIEAEVEIIEISTNKGFTDSAKIDAENLPGYLAEDEMILPDLLNGDVCQLVGTITSLKSTRGDSLTFQTEDRVKTHNLEALPSPGKSSKDYKTLYREKVSLQAEVVRKSLYQKPKLKIIEAILCQDELPLDQSNEPLSNADDAKHK